jgi:replicative DNA helicase
LADRLALLQGLCDTDGYVTDPSASSVEFSTTSPALAEAVIEITQSLGGWATMSSRPGSYVKDGDTVVCRVNFRVILSLGPSGLVPVSSAKHLAKWRGTARISERTIVGVSEAGYEECRCISVDGPDNLYVTEGYLVTHNSAMGYGMALHAATLGHPVAFASLEMPARQLVTRALAASAGVDSHRIRHHTLSTYDRARLQKAADAQRALPISYLEATDQTGASIARDARKLRTQGKLDMLVIDYLQLVESGKASENRVQEISQLTRLLKKLAMELEIPIIVLSQLSRAVEQRQEKRPMLSDLRESGSVEQDADVVLFLYRDEYYDKKTEDQGIAEVIIAKQRSGPVGTVKLSYTAEMIRFGDLYQMAAAAD